jgi:hypothetical protein
MQVNRRLAAMLTAGTTLLTSGCYLHTYVKPLPTYISRAPTCAEAVAIFANAGDVRGAYEPVAEISIWHPADMRSPSPTFEQTAQRKRAAALGANGLILGHPIDQHQSFDAKTVAIFIRADSARARTVCASKRD